jgi:8-oxo-dGTP diphosphatase
MSNMTVEAAGGIVYRRRSDDDIAQDSDASRDSQNADEGMPALDERHPSALDGLEVCVVHRPKYDDWSWPKGKLELNESHRHAAVREIGEETGVHVALGPRLGEIEYPLDSEGKKGKRPKAKGGVTKHVVFWMARPIGNHESAMRTAALGPVTPADIGEIDKIVWVSVRHARRLLSHAQDRDILDLFVDRMEEGAENSRTLLIVRHGKAESRKQWKGTDADRPITPRGAAAAYALNRELACFAPSRLITSPWVRCLETIEVFSWQTGLSMVPADELTEDAFAENPQAAWERFEEEIEHALNAHITTAVCMHRPVIGEIFEHLRTMCVSKSLSKQLVASSPYMPTGNAVALSIVPSDQGPRIIDIQRMAPLVY